MMVAVLTDSTASIPANLIRGLGIEIVSYYIHRGSETLRDMVDVQPGEFAAWLKTASRLPTTANPSPGDYLVGLKNLTKRAGGMEIVALTMTSKGSGAYQYCLTAVNMLAEQMPKLRCEVVDTLQVGMSHGWAAVEAARLAAAGAKFDQVVQRAREVAQQGMMIQTADTLRYLYMGGRIGKAQHLVASALKIKPIISMQEGVIVALGTARGQLRAYRRIVDLIVRKVEAAGKSRIKAAFTHVAAPERVEQLRAMVAERVECEEVLVSELSSALAVHSGPGTVGVSFFPI